MRSAETLVSILRAASQAIECWFAVGDSRLLGASPAGMLLATGAADCDLEVEQLSGVVPEAVLNVVSQRVAWHWRAFEAALEDDPAREQTQAIHFALLACVNKELESLRDVECSLPPGVMRRWWVEYASPSIGGGRLATTG